jgi:hypothetical protein
MKVRTRGQATRTKARTSRPDEVRAPPRVVECEGRIPARGGDAVGGQSEGNAISVTTYRAPIFFHWMYVGCSL